MPHLGAGVGKGQPNITTDVRLVQQLVNRFQPISKMLLRVDGNAGSKTMSAIEDFQSTHLHMAAPDGIVAPLGPTFKALCNGTIGIDNIAWGLRVSSAFKHKAILISGKLGIAVDFLMSSMAFETGETFSASVQNGAGSGAVGLIQFMPSTAKALGTSTTLLVGMSPEKQLDYVEKYFFPKSGRLNSIEDVYMAILYPGAIGKAPASTLFSSGTLTYTQNKGLDADHNGRITVSEAAAKVRNKYQKGVKPGFLG